MELKEITDCFSDLKVVEKRCITEDFVELVFHSEEVDAWHRIITAFLDEPVKPQGQEPSAKDLARTANSGGIRLDQTLFEKGFENGAVIAKFWPWKDTIHITLRMALLKK